MTFTSNQIASNVALLLLQEISRRGNQMKVARRTGMTVRQVRRIEARLRAGDTACLDFPTALTMLETLGLEPTSTILAANLTGSPPQMLVDASEIRNYVEMRMRRA